MTNLKFANFGVNWGVVGAKTCTAAQSRIVRSQWWPNHYTLIL